MRSTCISCSHDLTDSSPIVVTKPFNPLKQPNILLFKPLHTPVVRPIMLSLETHRWPNKMFTSFFSVPAAVILRAAAQQQATKQQQRKG